MTHAELYAEYIATRQSENQSFEAWLVTVIEAQNATIAELVVANQQITAHAGNMALAAQMSHEQVVELYGDIEELQAELIAMNNQLRAIRLLVINKHYDRVLDMLCQPATKPAG